MFLYKHYGYLSIMTISSGWLLKHLVITKPYFWAKVTYLIKLWSQCKILSAFSFQNNRLNYFIKNAQIGEMLLFLPWLLNYNFSPASCSLVFRIQRTIYKYFFIFFLTLFNMKYDMAYLHLFPNDEKFLN